MNAIATLDALPRARIAHLPTPIEPLPNLSAVLGGPELWIKRDDQTGLATGGNKARKLEYLLAQALEAGADCVITAGSTQSNHARQTAAGAARLGLEAHLALYAPGGEPPAEQSGNLLIDHLLGAVIHWTDERSPYTTTIERVLASLIAEGKNPYVIPYGGSNAYGLLGYANAMREFAAQARGLPTFDTHVFASSSGGTQAGMILGAQIANLPPNVTILGISVDRLASDLARDVSALISGGAALLNLLERPDPAAIRIDDGYISGGYAVVGDAEREAIRLLAKHEGILADPVYTGRALAGLVDRIRQGAFSADQRILFWHTGGYAALFAFAQELGL